ncbi:MAG: serine/threonine protein kinase [Deltaproteobacteria bacterium]|nr:serine/threonine protein kinase [Deltaproteobacteria bacterium]
MENNGQQKKGVFDDLGPDRVLGLVEDGLGVRCTNLFRPLTSYINRVYELEQEDGTGLIAKFYRPGRWSKDGILDEHTFLLDLAEQEVPVIAPLRFQDGTTLAGSESLLFAVFPKCGGRSFDEYNDDQWLELGRLLGRVHNVGATKGADHRISMHPEDSTISQLHYLMDAHCVPDQLKPQLQKAVLQLTAEIAPLFKSIEQIRIHGDCHFANMIYRPGESFFIIDFDDMAMGPAVQDIWMLLPGELGDSFVEIDYFLEGYETFRPFDRRTLGLIEPLRAMRFIHYMAWCAHQVEEDGGTRAIDGFGSGEYWQSEIRDLEDQLLRIRKGTEA